MVVLNDGTREEHYQGLNVRGKIVMTERQASAVASLAAKHGAIGFCKSLARELVGSGVLVNCLAPVVTETDLLKEHTPQFTEYAKSRIPMGRFAKVEEIAAMTAWVASPECSFTTGMVFDVSGGRADY